MWRLHGFLVQLCIVVPSYDVWCWYKWRNKYIYTIKKKICYAYGWPCGAHREMLPGVPLLFHMKTRYNTPDNPITLFHATWYFPEILLGKSCSRELCYSSMRYSFSDKKDKLQKNCCSPRLFLGGRTDDMKKKIAAICLFCPEELFFG